MLNRSSRVLSRGVYLHHQVGAGSSANTDCLRTDLNATRRSLLVPLARSKSLATPFHQRCVPNYRMSLGHATRYLSDDCAHGPSDPILTLRHHRLICNSYSSPPRPVRKRKDCAGYCAADGAQFGTLSERAPEPIVRGLGGTGSDRPNSLFGRDPFRSDSSQFMASPY